MESLRPGTGARSAPNNSCRSLALCYACRHFSARFATRSVREIPDGSRRRSFLAKPLKISVSAIGRITCKDQASKPHTESNPSDCLDAHAGTSRFMILRAIARSLSSFDLMTLSMGSPLSQCLVARRSAATISARATNNSSLLHSFLVPVMRQFVHPSRVTVEGSALNVCWPQAGQGNMIAFRWGRTQAIHPAPSSSLYRRMRPLWD